MKLIELTAAETSKPVAVSPVQVCLIRKEVDETTYIETTSGKVRVAEKYEDVVAKVNAAIELK